MRCAGRALWWSKRFRILLTVGLWICLTVVARADDGAEVARLLAAGHRPEGVVFEIASADPRALDWALPRVQEHVRALRQRYPGLEIALVTHGREQFALTTESRAGQVGAHERVRSLVRDQNVPVHVCETFAERNGVGAEQFPEYVQVAPAGPAQVRAYRELGYTVIRLTRP